jgi:hypothetical protein
VSYDAQSRTIQEGKGLSNSSSCFTFVQESVPKIIIFMNELLRVTVSIGLDGLTQIIVIIISLSMFIITAARHVSLQTKNRINFFSFF